jgi:hypothetical protein
MENVGSGDQDTDQGVGGQHQTLVHLQDAQLPRLQAKNKEKKPQSWHGKESL